MATTKLEKLEFLIGVKDNASSKVAKFQKRMERLSKSVSGTFRDITLGAAGVWGSVQGITQALQPAIDMNRALSDVGALGVDAAGLKYLQAEAGKFAMAYGGTATEVVKSSYDIQSAIEGLTGQELTAFTISSGLLAKASKSSVENMTSYLGVMYGIFEDHATKMGKSKWAEQTAAQTVYVANAFRSSGESMSASFTSLGANATAAGIEVAEQMAVLGMLQTTMSGQESGTKYKAFLAGVGKAQKGLGLKFTDSQGRMLGMVDILEKIKGKYGETLTVEQQMQISKAFGTQEATALINLLLSKSKALSDTIEKTRGISSLDDARRIAKETTDVFQRMGGVVNVLGVRFGQAMLGPVSKVVDKLVAQGSILADWMGKYKNVTRLVGYGAIAWLGAAGAMGALNVVYGITKLSLLPLTGGFRLLRLLLFKQVAATGTATKAQWVFNRALWCNPITWIVIGVIALIGALVWLVFHWNEAKAYLGDTSWGQPLLLFMEDLERWWNVLVGMFTDCSWTKALELALTTAMIPVVALFRTIGELLDFAGFEAGATLKTLTVQDATTALMGGGAPQVESLKTPHTLNVPKGGLMGSYINKTANNGKTVNIGEQHVHVETPAQSLEEAVLMGGM